jgi:hypothetical protein
VAALHDYTAIKAATSKKLFPSYNAGMEDTQTVYHKKIPEFQKEIARIPFEF